MKLESTLRFVKKMFPYWAPVWTVGLIVVAATLGASHLYAQPRPRTNDPSVAASMALLRGHDDGILVVHVLYSECRCSVNIVEHLLDRGPLASAAERILLVGSGGEMARKLEARGYPVRTITQDALLADYHLSAAPLLLVLGKDDRLRYVGGHTGHKQGLDFRDVAIVEAIEADRTVSELPNFGCAVSKDLQRRLDPLALKYQQD